MKSKEEIETSITLSIIDKPEMLKYVTSVPYGFNKPNYEAMSLMVYGYNQCQEDMTDKKYTQEDIENAFNSGRGYGVPDNIKDFNSFINSLNKQD